MDEMKKFNAIWAQSLNGVIGKGLEIPWHVPEDFAHFRKVTMGQTVIMGSKTFKSLPKLLPGRKHVILSRNKNFTDPKLTPDSNVEIYNNIEELLTATPQGSWVIGGGEIYKQLLPYTKTILQTEINLQITGNNLVKAPEILDTFIKIHETGWEQSRSGLEWRVITFIAADI